MTAQNVIRFSTDVQKLAEVEKIDCFIMICMDSKTNSGSAQFQMTKFDIEKIGYLSASFMELAEKSDIFRAVVHSVSDALKKSK